MKTSVNTLVLKERHWALNRLDALSMTRSLRAFSLIWVSTESRHGHSPYPHRHHRCIRHALLNIRLPRFVYNLSRFVSLDYGIMRDRESPLRRRLSFPTSSHSEIPDDQTLFLCRSIRSWFCPQSLWRPLHISEMQNRQQTTEHR